MTAVLLFPRNDIYNKHKNFRQSFGIIQYETLNHMASDSELSEMQPIFDDVKEAISYSGEKETFEIAKPLKELCVFTDDYDYIKNQISLLDVTNRLGN